MSRLKLYMDYLCLLYISQLDEAMHFSLRDLVTRNQSTMCLCVCVPLIPMVSKNMLWRKTGLIQIYDCPKQTSSTDEITEIARNVRAYF